SPPPHTSSSIHTISVATIPSAGNDAAPADANSTVDVVALTPKKKREAVGSLGQPEHQQLIKEDIDNLYEKTRSTHKAFEDINSHLQSFKPQDKNVEYLRLSWDALYKRYNDLVSKCEADLTMIKVMCDAYNGNIVPLLDNSRENREKKKKKDIRIKLQPYIERSEKGSEMFRENSDLIYTLHEDARVLLLAADDYDVNMKDIRIKVQAYIWRSEPKQLHALSTFWGLVSRDLKEASSRLDKVASMQEDRDPGIRLFKSTLGDGLIGTIYQTLGDTFEKYIAQVYKLREKTQLNDGPMP
ncbi:hypothetical protein V5O48_018168, partial [Marasmius crinis-equi]